MVKEIPLTRGKVAIVDDEDYEQVNQFKWCAVSSKGKIWYAVHAIWKLRKNIPMHYLILNINEEGRCDHINGDGLDNRRCNLRFATRSQNNMNRRKKKGGTSHFKGVIWEKNASKNWRARITINRKIIHLGNFTNEIDAAKAYDDAAKKYFGEYAKLNFNESSHIM